MRKMVVPFFNILKCRSVGPSKVKVLDIGDEVELLEISPFLFFRPVSL